MKILVDRYIWGDTYTISKVCINGTYLCIALEDKVREVAGKPVAEWKIKGVTAIPRGIFALVMDFSQHFQKILPHIMNVPGYEGVRIHGGNKPEDTEGCILLGMSWKGGPWISDSQKAMQLFTALVNQTLNAGDQVDIEIRG